MPLRRLVGVGTAGAIAALALLTSAACGGDDQAEEAAPGAGLPAQIQVQPEPVQPLDSSPAEPRDGVIDVVAENASFHPNRLKVGVGGPVTIRLTNRDGQAHSLRIAGLDGKYETEDDAVTAPDTIEGGASGEVNFAPQVAGAYTFRCDFHPGGMGGQIVVE